jgi:dTDP-4-dehydrorhamnose reductase
MRLLIAGAGGLVGRAVFEHCTRESDQIARLDHTALDITDEDQVNATFDRERPEVVVNCAAWTDVDQCELDPDRARKVNAYGPELLALGCRRLWASS